MQKPKIYAEIPSDFDQTTQYIVQKEPIDMGDHLFYDIEVREMSPDDIKNNE